MQYEIAFSDFDDTLCRSDGSVSMRTVEAVKDYINAGGRFVICTGRMLCSIRPIAQSIGLKGLIASYQGALITDIETGEVVSHMPVSNKDAVKVLKDLEGRGFYCHIYLDDKLYIKEFRKGFTDMYVKACKVSYTETGKDLYRYLEECGGEPTKIIAMTDPTVALEVIDTYGERYPDLAFNNSKPQFVEIVNGNTGKGAAVRRLCNIYGIDISKSIAFGDSLNDKTMLLATGLGVAVGNAADRVKSIAGYIADSNDEDGVAKILEKIIGGEKIERRAE
ncbi:MAG: Cof-type HAD-IIB family hydrolase [Christensenellales bacterium]